MALTSDLGLQRNVMVADGIVIGQARAAAVFRPGGIVGRRRGSSLLETPLSATPRPDLVIVGIFVGKAKFTASSTADGGGGAIDADSAPQGVSSKPGKLGWFATGSGVNEITAADVDKPCFVFDDDTVYLTDNAGKLPFGGFIDDVREDGRVRVRIGERSRELYAVFSADAEGETSGDDSDRDARVVITAIGAYTYASGTITADANNATLTGDGATLALGDIVFLPPGVAADLADAGVYFVDTLTGASAKFVLRRAPWFGHGDDLPLNFTVTVGSEGTAYAGTEWKAFGLAGSVIGTDDPTFWPRRTARTITLASGTLGAAIQTLPIRSLTLSTIAVSSYPTAAPHASTVMVRPSAVTAGNIATASIQVVAESAPGTTNTSDVGTYNLSVTNW